MGVNLDFPLVQFFYYIFTTALFRSKALCYAKGHVLQQTDY